MKAERRGQWIRWTPLLIVTGLLAACQPAVSPEPASTAGTGPAPTESRASCDDSAIQLLDRGQGIHGAIVTDTLHMGGATAPAACSAPVNQSLAGVPDDRTAQAQQSRYYLIVIRYPGGNRLYVISRRGDGTSCVVDLNDECIAQVTDLPDDFDLEDLPDDVAPTIPAGRPAPGAPEEPAAPDEPVTPNEPGAPAAPGATVTLPGAAGSPQPRDGATSVTVDGPLLSWAAGARATSYDLYWGTGKNLAADADLGTPVQTTTPAVTIRRPGATAAERRLAGETTYYWRVDAKNDAGATSGNVWSFTTGEAPPPVGGYTPPVVGLPAAPGNPQPRDGAAEVTVYAPVLRWSAGAGASSYDLYWGSERYWDERNLAADEFLGTPIRITGTSYTIPKPRLNAFEKYYWRVDAKNDQGITRGTVWSFTSGQVRGPDPKGVDGTLWIDDASWIEGSEGELLERRVNVYWRGHSQPAGTETKYRAVVSDVTATGYEGPHWCIRNDDPRCAEAPGGQRPAGANIGDDYTYYNGEWIFSTKRRGTPASGWLTFYFVGDNTKEADETFRVTIAPVPEERSPGPVGTCGRCVATITIKNDD